MTDLPPEAGGGRDRGAACSHPWLRVVCGECGQPVELLGPDAPVPDSQTSLPAVPTGSRHTRGVFIVARGHPELVEQLRAAMGQSAEVQIIEDRRRVPREPVSPEQEASAVRTELRKRVREDEAGEAPVRD